MLTVIINLINIMNIQYIYEQQGCGGGRWHLGRPSFSPPSPADKVADGARMSGCRGGWSSRWLEIPPAYHGLRLWVAS